MSLSTNFLGKITIAGAVLISSAAFAAADNELRTTSGVSKARITFYNPDSNSQMEGGGKNRYGERINSIEDSIRNGKPVSIAGDIYGSFGKECNKPSKRCLVLIRLKGFDRLFPNYKKRFTNLPKNSFIAIVEDTGGAFFGKGGGRLDLAARNRSLANGIPSGVSDKVLYMRLANPCGAGKSGRTCDFTEAAVSPTAVAMMPGFDG